VSCGLGSRVRLVLLDLLVDEKPITIVMDEGVSPSRRVNFFLGCWGLLFAISSCKKNVFKIFFLHSLSKKWFSTHIDIFGNTHKHTQIGNKIGNLPYLFTSNFINP
jgi:hypothetical protein